jgi:hypothetical protein
MSWFRTLFRRSSEGPASTPEPGPSPSSGASQPPEGHPQGVVSGDYLIHAFRGEPPRAICGKGLMISRLRGEFDPAAAGVCPDCAARARIVEHPVR